MKYYTVRMSLESLITAGFMVCLITFFLFLIVAVIGIYAIVNHGETSIAAIGQFGDSFGIITCVFTGIGIFGLVLTLHMQYEQSDLQYKELQRLDRATEENRIALDFQRREQFLTARLNATLALIQAREIEARAAQGTGETRRDEFAEESLQLRHQVGILLAESDLMFDNSVPNDKLQIISIKNYIHDITYKFKRNYNIYKMAPGGGLDVHTGRFARDVGCLIRLLDRRHPQISRILDSEWNRFNRLEKGEGDVEAWFDEFLSRMREEQPFVEQPSGS